MKKIFIFLFLTSQLQAQNIVNLDKFDPYEFTDDTIWFNRNHYNIVQTTQLDTNYTTDFSHTYTVYDITYFIMARDSADVYHLRQRKVDLLTELEKSTSYKENDCHCFQDLGKENWTNEYLTKLYVTLDIHCFKGGLKFDLMEEGISSPEQDIKKSTVTVNYRDIPWIRKMLDSISMQLLYPEYHRYDIVVNFGKKPKVSIESNYTYYPDQPTRIPGYKLGDIYKYLSDQSWPVVIVAGKTYPYKLEYIAWYSDFIEELIEIEQLQGFKKSAIVFKDNPNVFFLTDSMNQKTFIYTPEYNYEAYGDIFTGPSRYCSTNFSGNNRWYRYVDVDNDGDLDFGTDSSYSSEHDKHVIDYVPNLKNLEDYPRKLITNHCYNHSFGNNFFYLDYGSGYSEHIKTIYFLKNDHKYEVVSYKITKKYKFGRYKPGRYADLHEFYAPTKPELYRRSMDANKGHIMDTEFIKRLYYYMDHPDQLSIDFPEDMILKKSVNKTGTVNLSTGCWWWE